MVPKHADSVLNEMGLVTYKPMGSPHLVKAKSLEVLGRRDQGTQAALGGETESQRCFASGRRDTGATAFGCCVMHIENDGPRKGGEVWVKGAQC